MNKPELTPENCTGSFVQGKDGKLVLESAPTLPRVGSSKKKGFGQTKYVAPETDPVPIDAQSGDKPAVAKKR